MRGPLTKTEFYVEIPQEIQQNSIWKYLKKYKNNHTPHCLRNPAPTQLLTIEFGNKDLLPFTLLISTVLDLA